MVYHDYDSIKKVYSHHTKRQIENNEMVILLPYYETPDRTRATINEAGVKVRTQEGSGFSVITDSYAAFLGFQQDNKPFFFRPVLHAIVSKKNGICIIADMGVFILIGKVT